MLSIYAIPPSLYCAKLRIALRAKGLDWVEVVPPGGYGSETYREIIASGNLPALIHGDLALADSEAIAEYIDERWPEPPLLPGDAVARARARELSRFHDTRLEPELRRLFPYLPGRAVCPSELRARQESAINRRLDDLGRMLATRPDAGAALTLGDCGYPVTFLWLDRLSDHLGLEMAWPDTVRQYRARIDRLKPVADELRAYRPALDALLHP